MIYSLFIINKAGTLIYLQPFGTVSPLSANEGIVLASTFHSLHAITAKISPVSGCSGMHQLDTDTFKINCIQTLTGTKFLVTADPTQNHTETLLRKIYELYTDYVLKNPFYPVEMPIRGRCDAFETHVSALVAHLNSLPPYAIFSP